MLVIFSDGDLLVPGLEIQCREVAESTECLEDVLIARLWVGIHFGGIVKLSKINAETAASILLLCHYHSSSPWAGRGVDDALLQHLLHLMEFLLPNDGVLPSEGNVTRGLVV